VFDKAAEVEGLLVDEEARPVDPDAADADGDRVRVKRHATLARKLDGQVVEVSLTRLPGLRTMRSLRTDPDPELTAALTTARIAVTDLMLFAGVDPEEARAATREEERRHQELKVPPRAAARQPRFDRLRRWFRRR
jgi:hypothetical protein